MSPNAKIFVGLLTFFVIGSFITGWLIDVNHNNRIKNILERVKTLEDKIK